MPSIIRAAVLQAAPVPFDMTVTLLGLADIARDATPRGADLIVIPKAFVGGYPKGLYFGARLGTRIPEGRKEFYRYYENAIDLSRPEALRLSEIACDNSHAVVAPSAQRLH